MLSAHAVPRVAQRLHLVLPQGRRDGGIFPFSLDVVRKGLPGTGTAGEPAAAAVPAGRRIAAVACHDEGQSVLPGRVVDAWCRHKGRF